MPKGTDVHVGFFCPQSKQIYLRDLVRAFSGIEQVSGAMRTLLAGLVFSFSKIFSDCCFVARPLILAICSAKPGPPVSFFL